MKKLFIVGLGSLTGHTIANMAKNEFNISGTYNLRNPNFDFAETEKINIKNFSLLENKIKKEFPDYIINTSALNNVDYCEQNFDEALTINSKFVKSLAELSDRLDIPLAQISTDSIFDGTKNSPYDEDDHPNPINNYGKSKLLGEQSVSKYDQNLIIRVSVLYGWLSNHLAVQESSSLKQFNFGHWLILKLKANEPVKIITDEISTPILVDDLANSILHLIKSNHQGIYHSAPSFSFNRYDFSVKLADYLGLNSKLISPTINAELGRNVQTAKNKCLNSTKLMNTGFDFLSLDESFSLLKQQINL